MGMPAPKSFPLPSNAPSIEDKSQITCHLVSLPKIILTRIDDGSPLPKDVRFSPKKPLKRLNNKNNKTPKSSFISSAKQSSGDNVKRARGRPKKVNLSPSSSKSIISKLGAKVKNVTSKNVHKDKVKINSLKGKVSKKTLLQKKSKIAIPPIKKLKQNLSMQKKQISIKSPTQKKSLPPKPKLSVLPSKQDHSDTSGDEFLYDQLIEEIESTARKQISTIVKAAEKTTNITLKSNIGNKPPIIVKGGIVKKTDLPADLKSIASPKQTGLSNGVEILKSKVQQTSLKKKKVKSNTSDYPGVAKKASPWPVSISPKKTSVSANKNQKKSLSKVEFSQNDIKGSGQAPIIYPTNQSQLPTNSIKPKSTAIDSVKPKIGPKQTAKVVPLSKSLEPDGNLSDEYLEEETLECEFEPPYISTKVSNMGNTKTRQVESQSNDDDPNLDLLRILTDDSDELTVQPEAKKESILDRHSPVPAVNKVSNEKPLISDTSRLSPITQPAEEVEDEPPARTIYELMNEIALNYPSWNLHIIPETSAFCIAQVTKGRLGLPTLKKCIELDPIDYNAKVYIHQYHIKRFDGVYDSEESILALIHEINNIKA